MTENKKVFYGWIILIACIFLMGLGYAPLVSCASLFISPVTEDLGFARGAYTITTSIASLMMAFMSPVIGKLMAGKDMRKTIVICTILNCLVYLFYSMSSQLWQFYLTAMLVGITECGCTMVPVSCLITNWFKKARGTAISIALAGSGIGGAIISPILTMVIQNMGWRPAFVIFGIVMIVVEVPVALFLMRPRPEDMNLQPYGADENAPQDVEHKDDDGVPLSALKKYPFFWIYWVGMFVMGLVGFGSLGQLAASLTDAYGQGFFAMIISFFLLLLTPAKISLGWVYDKIGPKFGTIYVMGFFAIALAMLLITNSTTLMWVMAIFYSIGICSGTVTPPVVTAATFGSKYYGEIYGFVNFGVMAGGALGAPVVAAVYDLAGSYDVAWVACSILCIVSTVLLVIADIRCRQVLGKA